MKRRILALLLAVLTLAALTTAAFAAEADEMGVYNIRTTNGYQLTVEDVKSKTDFYVGASKFKLNCTKLPGQYSLVFMIRADATGAATTGNAVVPTEKNLHYIDQQSVEEKAAAFDLIPKELTAGTYNVYVSTDGTNGLSLKKVASFEYGKHPGYRLGDVDNDGEFTAADALAALNISVGLGTWTDEQKLAAHVLGDADVSAADALTILRRSVGLISSF